MMTKEDGEELMRLREYLKLLATNTDSWARQEELKVGKELRALHKRLSERREVEAWIA